MNLSKTWRCLTGVLLALPIVAQSATFKIATWAPDGTTWMKEMRAGAQEVELRTQGRVSLKFFPGGVMGNDDAVMRKMKVGQLHGGAFTGISLSTVYPDAQLYSLPMLFRNYGEVDYVRQKMDDKLRTGLEQAGMVPIGFTEGGFAYLLSQKEIAGRDDLKKSKVWVPEGDLVNITAFQAAGVSPVPLPFADVYTGLQTGLLDTVAIVPTAAIAFQWHTKLKTLTDYPVTYIIGILALNRKSFDEISPADQQVLRKVMDDAFERLNRLNRLDNENARKALEKQGIEFVTLDADEQRNWREFADEAIAKLKDRDVYTPALLDELRQHLATYRATGGKQAD